jgi:hypothetical protein
LLIIPGNCVVEFPLRWSEKDDLHEPRCFAMTVSYGVADTRPAL